MSGPALRTLARATGALALLLAGAAIVGALPGSVAAAASAALAAVAAAEAWIAARERGAGARGAPREALLDTSALIDGRIGEIGATGFLAFDLVVPEFVLRELQHVADASDAARRARGRRGLEILESLRESPRVALTVIADDVPGEREVDAKLVAIARRRGAALVTTDFNLNKVASIRGVSVLNVNALAHAVRPAMLPGQTLTVTIVKEGKEPGQGVAYLDDGTMIVVDQAKSLVGRAVSIVVTSALQTAAGKMFFGRLDN